jgi:catechol 2,3-dioxygenase-like lactoylglutathione lyase family enzyme
MAMGFVSLLTQRYDDMAAFYRDRLGGRVERSWDRAGARGMLLDLGGLRVELMDASREKAAAIAGEHGGRIHLVVEVSGLARRALAMGLPAPATTSWGASLVTLADPDGLPVSLLEWSGAPQS